MMSDEPLDEEEFQIRLRAVRRDLNNLEARLENIEYKIDRVQRRKINNE